jgi:hypothetical protein
MKNIYQYLYSPFFIGIFIFALLASFFYYIVFPKPDSNEEFTTIYKDWGIVSSIEYCRNSKYSLRCKVTTDKFIFNDLDITDFPSNLLVKGDEIGQLTKLFNKSSQTYLVSNKEMISISSCFNWMPCFNQYSDN